MKSKLNNSESKKLYIVGIGASAGGLEALELFLAHVPESCGLAFVIVQHLSPTHKGMLVELLQRSTPMPVTQIKDQMQVEPNHVYVIPPGYDLGLLDGYLHLLEPPTAHTGQQLSVDFFFHALANDQEESGIGVILSGMGSDGSVGIKSIKEKKGFVFAQTPNSAKFDSMPQSAINTGLVDCVAPAEELPHKILSYLKEGLVQDFSFELTEDKQNSMEKILILLRAQTGQDFFPYKMSTIYRRVQRRMNLHNLKQMSDYVLYLRKNHQESSLLFKELLIGVTQFFRDPDVWEQLKNEVFPEIFAAHSGGKELRAWVSGCSTGEEAYSLAMVFKEAQEKCPSAKNFSLQIFATDLDTDAINKARAGIYPVSISDCVSQERLRRFFVENKAGFKVGNEIRDMQVFANQNVAMDASFSKLDIISCRNLFIYLDAELQKRLIQIFHYNLNSGGILVLGSAESIGTVDDLFVPLLPAKTKLYRRINITKDKSLLRFSNAYNNSCNRFSGKEFLDLVTEKTIPSLGASDIQQLVERLLQPHTPAAVLVTETGDIIYISGKTGKYLEPAAGKANLNIFSMAREGLKQNLNIIFFKAIQQKKTLTTKTLKAGTNGSTQFVDITVEPVLLPTPSQQMALVVFTDRAPPVISKTLKKGSESQTILAHELQQSLQELLIMREKMEKSREELKSANEELQSTNEELQSMNEELTTSKGEMQSMNDELQTANNTLKNKVHELSRSSNDMRNLLKSSNIATLFLDDALNVQRFTPQTKSIIKLLPSDTGRPITDLVTDLEYPTLVEDTKEVLQTLVFMEKQIPASQGRWFRVRIMPYRTLENQIDGVVISFFDISDMKKLEMELEELQKIKK